MTDWIIPFLCGLGASILSAWGVGGGTLLLLVMTLFLDVDQRTAQGINLLFVAVLRKPFGVYLLLSGVSLLWPQRRKKQA